MKEIYNLLQNEVDEIGKELYKNEQLYKIIDGLCASWRYTVKRHENVVEKNKEYKKKLQELQKEINEFLRDF